MVVEGTMGHMDKLQGVGEVGLYVHSWSYHNTDCLAKNGQSMAAPQATKFVAFTDWGIPQ